jgi:hypothetical protein
MTKKNTKFTFTQEEVNEIKELAKKNIELYTLSNGDRKYLYDYYDLMDKIRK